MAHNKQDNNLNIDGKVVHITAPKYISEKLSTRTLIMEIYTGEWRNEVPFVFKNARMDTIKDVKEGDWVNVQFQLSGNKGRGEGEPRWFGENQGLTAIKG
jgi:hypothetical protein